jgi:hypothetical protein
MWLPYSGTKTQNNCHRKRVIRKKSKIPKNPKAIFNPNFDPKPIPKFLPNLDPILTKVKMSIPLGNNVWSLLCIKLFTCRVGLTWLGAAVVRRGCGIELKPRDWNRDYRRHGQIRLNFQDCFVIPNNKCFKKIRSWYFCVSGLKVAICRFLSWCVFVCTLLIKTNIDKLDVCGSDDICIDLVNLSAFKCVRYIALARSKLI